MIGTTVGGGAVLLSGAAWLIQTALTNKLTRDLEEAKSLDPDGDLGKALAVIDTKYKVPDSPSTDDVAQVVAYAEAKGCHEAALVYPARLLRPLNTRIGEIRVRTLTFSLDGDLDQNGAAFVRELLSDRV
jgi:hypothetical protein